MASADGYRELGEAAWSWVHRHVADDDGPWMPVDVPDEPEPSSPAADRDSWYAGIAGLVPLLAEIALHRAHTAEEQDLAVRITTRLHAQTALRQEPSLYDGLAGEAAALHMLQPGAGRPALRRLAELATPTGWRTTFENDTGSDAPYNDIMGGTAGIVLAAIFVGGEEADAVARTGADLLLDAAEPTAAGLDWGMRTGDAGRMPNFSHGAAGIATALAIAGKELGRADFVRAAVLGAQHVVSLSVAGDDGFVVPHTIPPSRREVEPVTYSWCHGPTGTSYLFPALAHAGVGEVGGVAVGELHRRCMNSIIVSGVPQRLRPGFWDNDGRCCGTAGVGDALLDAAQDCAEAARAEQLVAAASTMGDALVARAVLDRRGARWRFVEHRDAEPLLPPGTSWMQGAAGIAAFLLRLARVLDDRSNAPVVDRPDQWWAVPGRLRTVHTG